MRVSLTLALVLLAGCSSTGSSGYGGYPSSTSASAHGRAPARTAVGVEVVFTEEEVRIIRAYYETHGEDTGHGHGKGKGHKKAGGLPPGIAKNLARGKPLPPGLAKSSLPYDLQRRLPPAPSGYERIVVAGKILLIEVATQVVRDVLTDAMFS
jgi:hypothetical protein